MRYVFLTLVGVLLPMTAQCADVFLGAGRPSATLDVSSDDVVRDGYTVQVEVNLDKCATNEPLLEIPGGLSLAIRMAGDRDAPDHRWDKDNGHENYFSFCLPDATCPVLEAMIPGPAGRIGVPLGALKNPGGDHSVVLQYTGVHWTLCVDGRNTDEDHPRTPAVWENKPTMRILSKRVASAKFSSPARIDALPETPKFAPVNKPIQFFTPADHNAWVGDVSLGYFKGRFHIFYLFDRRHHASKGGKGGHFFAHLSTTNLADWYEHPHATPIEHQWETQGTGTPFVYDGKLCLAYGLHTTRIVPEERTTGPVQEADFRKTGVIRAWKFDEIEGVPMGATYSVSDDDGITFHPSNTLIHTAQNLAIYNRDDGSLCLFGSYGSACGRFLSRTLGDWVPVQETLPVKGDCPAHFEWNGRHYLLQGFTDAAMSTTDAPNSYVDLIATGNDIYDGLSVPMVAPFAGNRRIMAGWIAHPCGWGGWLALRELVQYPDGMLGSKWVPECTPDAPNVEVSYDKVVDLPESGSAMYILKNARTDIPTRFRFSRGDADPRELELCVNPLTRRVQVADAAKGELALEMPTLYDRRVRLNDKEFLARCGNPNGAGSLAICNVRGLDQPFEIRVIAWYDRKSRCTLFDAEIAGQRTILCRRSGGKYENVRVEARNGYGGKN